VANAQHEGYLESEPAYYTARVPAIWEPSPSPQITCEYVDNDCYLYVSGEGELTVSINGVEIPDFTSPYIIQAKLGEDQEFEIMATAQLEGYLESMPAYYWVHLDGIWVQAQPPTFDFTWTDESVIGPLKAKVIFSSLWEKIRSTMMVLSFFPRGKLIMRLLSWPWPRCPDICPAMW
jgi:hypothetical protein